MPIAFGRMQAAALGLLAAVAASPVAVAAGAAPLRVTVDHAEAVTLDAAAASVLIADPAIADIVNERSRVIFVLGKKPGATNLLIYDGAGRRLVAREVIVMPSDTDDVTVTRATDQSDYICAPRCAYRDHLAGAAAVIAGADADVPAAAAPGIPPAAGPGGAMIAPPILSAKP